MFNISIKKETLLTVNVQDLSLFKTRLHIKNVIHTFSIFYVYDLRSVIKVLVLLHKKFKCSTNSNSNVHTHYKETLRGHLGH